MKHLSQALVLTALSGALLSVAMPVSAQTTTRFSSVEFKDTTLNDALELIFKAANNPVHNIDPSAALVPVGQMTLQNIAWDSALRQLANQNGFKVSRGTDGIYIVEPRAPVNAQGGVDGSFGGPMGGGFGAPMGGMGVPANPFGAPGAFGGAFRNQSTPQADLALSTQVNAQTVPRFGGGSDAGSSDNKKFTPIFVRHVYAGGIALLFQNSAIISTEQFVSPASSSSNGGSGGGGGRNGGRGGGVSGIGGGGGGGFGGGGGGLGGGGLGF